MTETARVDANVRAAHEAALRDLDQGFAERGIAGLVRVTEQATDLVSAQLDLGIAYARSGDLDRAAASLEKAVALSPAHPIALNELGVIYRRQGRFAAARQSYEKALAAYPDLHFARRNLAIVCDLYLGDIDCALENYEAYGALAPQDEAAAIWISDARGRLNL